MNLNNNYYMGGFAFIIISITFIFIFIKYIIFFYPYSILFTNSFIENMYDEITRIPSHLMTNPKSLFIIPAVFLSKPTLLRTCSSFSSCISKYIYKERKLINIDQIVCFLVQRRELWTA